MEDYQAELECHAAFPVRFTRDVFACANPDLASVCAAARPALFFMESAIAAAFPGLAERAAAYFRAHDAPLAAPPVVMEGGEKCKDGPAAAFEVVAAIARHGLDRHSLVFACGGGAFLDCVGFGAALAHRGVRLVRLPTTALAQGDSAVGVKNGVDYLGEKNFIGTFAAPWGVVSDLAFLAALPVPLRRDGLAEALKVAIIKDAAFFAFLEGAAPRIAAGELPPLEEAVMRSARLHSEHIAENRDPFEMGSARPLDFGHWSAHWLEAASGYQTRHGEGVALGIALDSIIAKGLGLLSAEECARVLNALRSGGFALWHPLFEDPGRLLAGVEQFRRHLGGELCLTLPEGLGRRREVHEMPGERVTAALGELRAFAKQVSS